MLARLVHGIALAATTLAVSLAGALPAQAATIVVGPSDGSCSTAIFSRIQSALDAAVPGTTILVCAGVYPEQLVVAKRVRIVGSPGARLVPNGLDVVTTSLRSGRPVAAAIVVRGTATIDGLAIDVGGHGIAQSDGTEPLLAGIYVRGVAAGILGTTVTGTRIASAPPGCENGVGVLVQGSGAEPRVRIEGNSIDGYQRAGIVVQDGVRARIRQNFVVGGGDTPHHAQTGIEVATGATARIEENVVRGHAGPSGLACELDVGIAVGAARARVRGNQLESNGIGIHATARGHTIRDNAVDGGGVGLIGLRVDADESRITANTIATHAAAGILVAGNRNRLGSSTVSAVHQAPLCDTVRANAACSAILIRCGVGVWILGRANKVATTVFDADTPVVDDGRANAVR